jgi:hypothetical protein
MLNFVGLVDRIISDHFFQVIVVSFDNTVNNALFFNPSQPKQFIQENLIARF